MSIELMKRLSQESDLPSGGKIVMAVMDGLGGLPITPGGPTELEAAHTPCLDKLAAEGTQGLSLPVDYGVTPGSGPGHLGLFGYDPLEFEIGRGVLEAFGIDFQLQPDDLAARGNFCTIDGDGNITDRRAGRIASDIGKRACEILQRETKLDGYEIFVMPVKEYRFVLVLRGPRLRTPLGETDPQKTGVPRLAVEAQDDHADTAFTADLLNDWLAQATKALSGEEKANACNLRGLGKDPGMPTFQDVYGLNAAAVAVYPMYRGIARLCGMDVLQTGDTMASEIEVLRENWDKYDFFFVHFKYTDSRGEDGDFEAKKAVIEECDGLIGQIAEMGPSVLVVTGDHSTPAAMKAHSFHEVPTLFHGELIRPDTCTSYGERPAMIGGLGHFPAKAIMPLAMGRAGRLAKYGA